MTVASLHRTLAFVAAATIASGLALSQVSASPIAERVAAGEPIRIGAANIAPHVVLRDGTESGEAIEVVRQVLAGLDIDNIEIVSIDFGGLIPALQAGRIDMIASGMSITPPRCEVLAFSDPYYAKSEALIVAKGNPLGTVSFADIAATSSARLGFVLGGTEGPQSAAAGVAESQISNYPDSATLADALKAGRIDALALPDLQVNWLLMQDGWDNFETPGPFIPQIDGQDQILYTAFGFSQADAEFRDEFNAVLDTMKNDGSVAAAAAPFAVTQFAVDLAKDKSWTDICSQ